MYYCYAQYTLYQFILQMSQKIKVKKLQNSPYVVATDQLIGKGSFSTIVKAYNLQNPKEQLVSKIISVKDLETSQTIKTQLQVLKKLPHHPNLVNCMKYQISSQNNFYLIMEFCNQGNLDKYMYKKKYHISEQKIWFFVKQFCQGYKVLYNNNIVHRDIKPENILIHNGDFKIADFGLSKKVQDCDINANMSSKGTPLYMAPQLHQQKQGSAKIDIFSLGVVLYRLAFGGQYPFFDQGRKYRSVNQYFRELAIRKLVIPKQFSRSQKLTSLIEKMLIKDKDHRISWKQIFQIEQIKQAVRYQRKKEMIPMQQLRRSLMIVNKSLTSVKIVEQSHVNGQQNLQKSQNPQDNCNIILEETFNKKNKNNFQKTLFHNKLLYTLIEYTNKKMKNFMKKVQKNQYNFTIQRKSQNYTKLMRHITKKMQRIIQGGVLFGLYLISRLQVISGDWSAMNQGEIMNFQDIFQNDKGIFLNHYKQLCQNKNSSNLILKLQEHNKNANKTQLLKEQQYKKMKPISQQVVLGQPKYIVGTYQDSLYNLLTEYFQYPSEVRTQLRPIIALLVDIYDLVIKSQTQAPQNQTIQKNNIQLVQDQTSMQFYQYLLDIQTIKEKQLLEDMQKKGLIFL